MHRISHEAQTLKASCFKNARYYEISYNSRVSLLSIMGWDVWAHSLIPSLQQQPLPLLGSGNQTPQLGIWTGLIIAGQAWNLIFLTAFIFLCLPSSQQPLCKEGRSWANTSHFKNLITWTVWVVNDDSKVFLKANAGSSSKNMLNRSGTACTPVYNQ